MRHLPILYNCKQFMQRYLKKLISPILNLLVPMISETLIQKLAIDLGLIHKLPQVDGINSNNNDVENYG